MKHPDDCRDARLKAFMAGTACAVPWCAECYKEWAERETLKEAAEHARHAAKALALDDPECETAVAALEEGWRLSND